MVKAADFLAWDFLSELIKKRLSEGWTFEVTIVDNRMIIDFEERSKLNGKEQEDGKCLPCN